MNSQHVIDAIYFLVVLNTVLCTDQNTSEIEVLDTCCSKGIGSQKALQTFTSTSTSALCNFFFCFQKVVSFFLFSHVFFIFWGAKKKILKLQGHVNTKSLLRTNNQRPKPFKFLGLQRVDCAHSQNLTRASKFMHCYNGSVLYSRQKTDSLPKRPSKGQRWPYLPAGCN